MTGKQQKKTKQKDVEPEGVIEGIEDQFDEVTQEDVTADPQDEGSSEIDTDDVENQETEDQDVALEVTIESLSEQIDATKKTAADNLDKAIRAQAELDNVQKRTKRDIENAHKYALEKFVNELLPVLDSMELGINASESVEDVSSLREGMDLTMKMFLSSLEKSGVKPVDPRKGDKFNPDQHEAVTMQEMGDAESGTVITTLQKGYELNGRLIRPAMVIVAK